MKLQAILVLGAVLTTGVFAPAANADTSYSVTTSSTELAHPSTVVETRSTTIESSPVVVREQPVIIERSSPVVVIKQKRKHRHFINVGPVHVF